MIWGCCTWTKLTALLFFSPLSLSLSLSLSSHVYVCTLNTPKYPTTPAQLCIWMWQWEPVWILGIWKRHLALTSLWLWSSFLDRICFLGRFCCCGQFSKVDRRVLSWNLVRLCFPTKDFVEASRPLQLHAGVLRRSVPTLDQDPTTTSRWEIQN